MRGIPKASFKLAWAVIAVVSAIALVLTAWAVWYMALSQTDSTSKCLKGYAELVGELGGVELKEKAFEYGDDNVTVEVFLAEPVEEPLGGLLVGEKNAGGMSLGCGAPGGHIWLQWADGRVEVSEYSFFETETELHETFGETLATIEAEPGDTITLAFVVDNLVVETREVWVAEPR